MLSEDEFNARARRIRLVAMDVDGVLTDGAIVLSSEDEAKMFHVRDGLGMSIGRSHGLLFAFVTGRACAAVRRRAEELRVEVVEMACSGKAAALRRIAGELGLALEEVAFLGDDWNDLPALEICGLSGAPSDAPEPIRRRVHVVTRAPGGRGVTREFLERLLDARGGWEAAAEAYARRLAAGDEKARQ